MKPLLVEEKNRYLAAAEASEAWAGYATDWHAPKRQRAIARFAELGFPSTHQENWKYTDISSLLKHDFEPSVPACEQMRFADLESLQVPEAARATLVFLDGFYCPELSIVDPLPNGVIFDDVRRVAVADGAAGLKDCYESILPVDSEPFVALNSAMTQGGAFLFVPKDVELDYPVHVLYLSGSAGGPTVAHPRTLVVAGRNSRATIVETFASASGHATFTNAAAEVIVGEGAAIEHYRVQRENTASFHIGATDARVLGSGRYSSVAVAVGAALSRHDLRVVLAEQGAECQIDGIYVLASSQHTDNHTRIDHSVPNCSSQQLYKGVLDEQARAVFNGKVVVHRDAQKTVAHQTNKNLVLSDRARVDTKPELEIFADDVVCTHGAAVGSLDEDEQFYLASRGIDPNTARGLLTYGFAEEVVGEIKIDSVRQHLDDFLASRFHKGLNDR